MMSEETNILKTIIPKFSRKKLPYIGGTVGSNEDWDSESDSSADFAIDLKNKSFETEK